MNKKILFAGLVASVAMAMLSMLFEAFWGTGFWAPPVFIAATVLRDLQAVAIPVPFLLIPVVLGMMGHMMNSVALGALFQKLVGTRLRTASIGMVYGAVYGLVIFALMWFAILPLIDPVMLALNPIVFALAHVVWGAVLGSKIR